MSITEIIGKIRKMISRRDVFIILSLILLYFATRLVALDRFPIFSDEGIYVRWTKIAWKNSDLRFISLTDGRQPFQTWATIPLLKIFEYNGLFAGRLFAVFSGFFSLTAVFTSAWYFFNKKTAYIASLLYIVTPYFLFYDRIALVDSAVTGFALWLFLLSVILAKTRRLDIALILGFVAGFGSLAKSAMRLYIALMLAALVFVVYKKSQVTLVSLFTSLRERLFSKKHVWKDVIDYVFLYGLAVAISVLIYNVQRLSPFFHYVEMKNLTFVLSLEEFLQNPFREFGHNILSIPYYYIAETGYVVGILGIFGVLLMIRNKMRLGYYYAIWILGTTIALSFVMKIMFPRYVLPVGGMLVIPAAYMITQVKQKNLLYAIIGSITVSILYFNYAILYDYPRLPFPDIDKGQYIRSWTAGWGAKEIVQTARDEAKNTGKPVFIISEGNFGMAADVLDTFLTPDDNIIIIPYWPLNIENLEENQDKILEGTVYVVYSHKDTFDSNLPIELVRKYEKPGGESALYLFKLLPSE